MEGSILGLKFDSLELNGGEIPLKLEGVPDSRAEILLTGARPIITEWKTK